MWLMEAYGKVVYNLKRRYKEARDARDAVFSRSSHISILITIVSSFYKQHVHVCAARQYAEIHVTKNYKPVTPRDWDTPLIRQP